MAGRLKRSPFADLSPAQAKRAESVIVENPYGNGVDHVNMVDPITAMARQGRLTEQELAAAGWYRMAFDAVHASRCSAMTLERVDGGGIGRSTTDRQLWGAHALKEASALLGPLERPLWRVVAEGATLVEIGQEFGEKEQRRAKAVGSAIIRAALAALVARA